MLRNFPNFLLVHTPYILLKTAKTTYFTCWRHMHYINTVSRVTTESSSSKSITYSWQASTSARLCCMLAFMHGAMATSQTAVSTLLSTWSIWMSILLYQEYGTLQFNVDVLFDITQKCTRYNILLMSIDTCFCFNGEIL